MKELNVNFVPDRRWRVVWVMVAAISVSVVVMAVWHARERVRNQAHTGLAIAQTQTQLDQIAQHRNAPATETPRQASIERAARVLRQDLNPLFAPLENVREPGSRLTSASYDGSAGSVRLEFALDSVARAASVTAALNAGIEDRRGWKLESVRGRLAGGARQAETAVGTWSGQLGSF